MNVVTYNVQFCRGRDGAHDVARVAAALRGADVIGLQEVERFWDRSGNVDQPAALAAALPDLHWIYGPSVDVHKQLGGDGPRHAVRRQFGNMVLSRHPILAARNLMLPRAAVRGAQTIQRAALEAVIAAPGGPLRVYCTHLCHLSGALRLRQAAALLDLHRLAPLEGAVVEGEHPDPLWHEEVRVPPVPRESILLGDFNMTADSPEYAVLAGERHPRLGRLTPLDGFADAWTAAGHAEDDGATCYADAAARTGRRIDFCFVSAGLADRVRAAAVDPDADGSDHQPLRITLGD